MYEGLVKRLREESEIERWLQPHSANETPKLLDDAADAIEELSKPRWIPVTEKLPGKDVPVLVYLFGDSPYIAWINHEGEWETEEFTIDRDYLPKAWMPLPEPPKEET